MHNFIVCVSAHADFNNNWVQVHPEKKMQYRAKDIAYRLEEETADVEEVYTAGDWDKAIKLVAKSLPIGTLELKDPWNMVWKISKKK